MAVVAGVVNKADVLTLSAAPDCVVNWSDLSFLYKTVRKLNRISHTILSSFYRICHFKCMLILCGC